MKVFQHILICDKNFVRTRFEVLQLDSNSFYACPQKSELPTYGNAENGFKMTRQNGSWEFSFEGESKWIGDDTLKEISSEIEYKLESCVH